MYKYDPYDVESEETYANIMSGMSPKFMYVGMYVYTYIPIYILT